MRAVVQRVTSASVEVQGRTVGRIETGLLALIGVTHDDTVADAHALARKIVGLRILRGELGVCDVPDAAVLAVSQFTLYGDTRKGRRPSWTAAAKSDVARPLFDVVVAHMQELGTTVRTGEFGADMRVELVNDGPITVLIEV